jgi:CheY-like chemotaxis protein
MTKQTSNELTILIAEDDDGHAELIIENLQDAGINNSIIRFRNGQETLDFFFATPANEEKTPRRVHGRAYMLLLDIRMPMVDGIEVLKQIKADPELRKMPVLMLTTTDDPGEIEKCYSLGCSCYITKPLDYKKFSEILTRLGLFLLVVQIPALDGE